MKSLFCTISLLIISTSYAADSIHSFCESPLKYTCPSDSQIGFLREQRINKIETTLKDYAFKEMLKDIDDPKIKETIKTIEDLDYLSPKKIRNKIQKYFYSHLRIAFSYYLKQSGLPSDLGITLIKDSLNQAINQSTDISSDIKLEMQNKITQTRLITFVSDIEESSIADVHILYKQCSKKTFVDNAFATELKKEKVIIVCPGEIIGSIEYGKDLKLTNELKIMPLVMTLGHELSHHFDWRYYPQAYSQLFQSLQNQSAQFTGPIQNYMSEITADVWGLKVTKILASKISDQKLRSDIFAGSMNDLCDTEDDGSHPSGDFRISFLANHYFCQ